MSELVEPETADAADWQRRVVGRSLKTARQRSIDRGASLIRAASTLLERSKGDGFTVQDVADEAGQSLRTLYQYFESKDDLLLAVFEEAMRVYARLIESAVAGLDDPLDRLAGAVMSAASMPAHTQTGVDIGLARLRLRLGQVEPEMVARSLTPVTRLLVRLVEDAVAADRVPPCDPEPAGFSIMSLVTAYAVSETIGNDVGLTVPDVEGLARFCLGGIGADTGVVDHLRDRLEMPKMSAAGRPDSVAGEVGDRTGGVEVGEG